MDEYQRITSARCMPKTAEIPEDDRLTREPYALEGLFVLYCTIILVFGHIETYDLERSSQFPNQCPVYLHTSLQDV